MIYILDEAIEFAYSDQEFTSKDTSINSSKLPALFKKVNFKQGTLNFDYGGGKFDNVTEYLADQGVENVVYDKYNRSAKENRYAIDRAEENGGADTVTCSNVLNVIKEPEERLNVLRNIMDILKPGGTAYFTVYTRNGSNIGAQTGKDQYQLNRKTSDYIEEIQEVFPEAKVKGSVIIAKN